MFSCLCVTDCWLGLGADAVRSDVYLGFLGTVVYRAFGTMEGGLKRERFPTASSVGWGKQAREGGKVKKNAEGLSPQDPEWDVNGPRHFVFENARGELIDNDGQCAQPRQGYGSPAPQRRKLGAEHLHLSDACNATPHRPTPLHSAEWRCSVPPVLEAPARTTGTHVCAALALASASG